MKTGAKTGNPQQHLLVVGGYGVVGTGVVNHILGMPDWRITTVGRSPAPTHLKDGRVAPPHIQADLLDAEGPNADLTQLSDVTAMVFCAYVERESMAATVAPNVDMLANALDHLRRSGSPLSRVVLIGGGKSYGAHLGPYKTPAKERDPRFMGPIFYNDQEDLLQRKAVEMGYEWTGLRPDAVLGPSIGSPMNLLMGLAAYASVSKELGIPLRFPGTNGAWRSLLQATDADVLAQAVTWAITHDAARGEIFNVTNGDNFRWEHLWPEIGNFFDMKVAPPQPMRLVEQMADKGDLWQSMVTRHRLRDTPWHKLASWPFVDACLKMDYDTVQSTIKIRQAGFNGCMDTHDGLIRGLSQLRHQKLIP